MKKSWCVFGFLALGVGVLINTGLWAKDHLNTADMDSNMSSFAPTQNNFFDNGKFANVGLNATTSPFEASIKPDKTWVQGGSSSVTSSTGRWAL